MADVERKDFSIVSTPDGDKFVHELCGWRPDLAREHFELFGQRYPRLRIVGAGPMPNRMMLFELVRKIIGKDTENYAQEIGDPFVAGTKVLMADGSEKNIEEIQIGETVVNHKGELAKVTNTIKKKFTGNIVTISLVGWDRTITATETHHGLIVDDGCKRKKFGEMMVGEIMLIPFHPSSYDYETEIKNIKTEDVNDHEVYCITTENEYTAIFNGIAQYQCTSFGGKNSAEHVQALPILNGQRDEFTNIFPSYIYGTERVTSNNGRPRMGYSEDGGVGAWVADAVMQYGVIASNTPNCPKYSGKIARDWGYKGPPSEFLEVGKQHIVKSAAAVQTVDDLQLAISNGYPVCVCSNVGFDMAENSQHFFEYSTHWSHCMCIIGYDKGDGQIPEHYCLLNSWGDAFGKVMDLRTNERWPIGSLRIRRKAVEAILREGDSYAFSTMTGFPAQPLPRDLFNLFD